MRKIKKFLFAIALVAAFLSMNLLEAKAETNGNISTGQIGDQMEILKEIIIVDDENPEGVVICSVGELVEEYGTNAEIIIVDDENPEGVVICSLGELEQTYGLNGEIIIVDDENPEGVVICVVGNSTELQ